jgi:hypothetical protein
VSNLTSKILVLMFGMTLLLSLSSTARASQISTVSFMYGYIRGSLEFHEEAHPTGTITYNLTVVAYLDVTIYNLTLVISGLVKEKWQTLHTEQIISYSMTEDENFTRQITVTLPRDTSERLYCVIEASTDKGFGKTAFYATCVRTITYDELVDLHDELLTNYSTLQAGYDQLLTNYDALNLTHSSLVSEYASMQTNYNLLNSSYDSLMTSYDSLTFNYDSLQEDYTYIKTKYDASLGELNIVRTLMYIFTTTTVIFVATTVYFRKKAPYVVLRKETAIKPEKE